MPVKVFQIAEKNYGESSWGGGGLERDTMLWSFFLNFPWWFRGFFNAGWKESIDGDYLVDHY